MKVEHSKSPTKQILFVAEMGFFGRMKGKKAEEKQRNVSPSVLEPQESIPLPKSYPRTYQLPDQEFAPPIRSGTNALPKRQVFSNDENETAERQELQHGIDCQHVLYEVENLRTQLQLAINGQYEAVTQLSHEQKRFKTVAEQLTLNLETGQIREQVLAESTDCYRWKLLESQQWVTIKTMYSTGLSHFRELRTKDKAFDQQRQELQQTQLEHQTASNSVQSVRENVEKLRTELGASSLRIRERDAQLEDVQKACKRLQSEIKILRMELKQSRENFDQTIAAHEVTKIRRNQLRDQLREQSHNAEQKARKESNDLREASEALRSTEMELIRARNETTTAKREAQQAKEETRIKDKRLEFVQQQCALLQARLVEHSSIPDKTRRHTLETMLSEPLLKKNRERNERPGKRMEGNNKNPMSKDSSK